MQRVSKKVISILVCAVFLLTAVSPTLAAVLPTVAAGTTVYSNEKAKVDASNAKDGYVMVAYSGSSKKPFKGAGNRTQRYSIYL